MSQSPTSHRVTVIGAGIVGVCCALWLQLRGHRALLLDGDAPGAGTSSGNACTIAVHSVPPINHPSLPWRLPKLLRQSLHGGPLHIDPGYALRHWPWFLAFLKHCRAAEVRKTSTALASLLAQTYDGLNPLLRAAKCEALLDDCGCLFVFDNEADYRAELPNLHLRREHGVAYHELSGDEVRELEPALKVPALRGVLFDDAKRVREPRKLTAALFECFLQNGGEWRQQRAEAVRRAGDGNLEVRMEDGEVATADKVVLAAGAFSKRIAGCGAENLPLGVERGYHVQFAGLQHLARRPMHWVGSGFYAVPTDAGLRFAGTVQLSGLSPVKHEKSLAYIARMAAKMFDLADDAPQTWLGFRPTFPDSLPAIGPATHDGDILYAFGHHHLGLTLAGITGKLIAQLAGGEVPGVDLTACRAGRFSPS